MIALFRSVARGGERYLKRPLDLLFVLELSKFLPSHFLQGYCVVGHVNMYVASCS